VGLWIDTSILAADRKPSDRAPMKIPLRRQLGVLTPLYASFAASSPLREGAGLKLLGVPQGAGLKETTSCGGFSPSSRARNCCSASWPSVASLIRKPSFAPLEYMS
jgi:hypothetical protein